MPSQKLNNETKGNNAPSHADPIICFSLSAVATVTLGRPPYDPLGVWVDNTSRRDNPIMDSLFDFGSVENPTENEPSHKKSTQKKTTQKKSTQKQPAENKSDKGEPAHKKAKTK